MLLRLIIKEWKLWAEEKEPRRHGGTEAQRHRDIET